MSQAKEGGKIGSAGANANPDWYVDHSKLMRGSLAHNLIALSLSTRSLAKIRCISAPTFEGDSRLAQQASNERFLPKHHLSCKCHGTSSISHSVPPDPTPMDAGISHSLGCLRPLPWAHSTDQLEHTRSHITKGLRNLGPIPVA